jgi:ribulose-phosphate 3-epimerase
VAIVPSTPVSLLSELLPIIDLVLVMTVDPGFGGQLLISSCLDKCRALAVEREKRGLGYFISVDGGVNAQTLPEIARSGADALVMGSAFFAAADPVKVVQDARASFKARRR